MTVSQLKRRMEDLLTSPSVIIFLITGLFGGIVWGIQLNILAVEGAERLSKMETTLTEQSAILQKTSILLDGLITKVDIINVSVISHEKAAQDWRQRIRLNEVEIDHLKTTPRAP